MNELEFDLQHGILTLRSDGGATRTLPLPPELVSERSGVENITGVTALPELAQLRLALVTGEHIGVQLRARGVSIEELRAGRPIVYLDQNHWSRLSAARFGHRPLAPAVAAAAGRLMQWAQDGRVLVPASSAHFTETVPLYGASRLATATAILQVSGGWQMRNPLHVRLEEIRRAVAGRAAGAADVLAPQADGFFTTRSDVGPHAGDGSLADMLAVAPSIIGLYDTLLETDAIADEGAVAETAARRWAQKWARLAGVLRANREPAETVRRVATATLIEDLIDDLLHAARAQNTTPERVIACLAGAEDPIARMPFLGQMRQLLFARLRNHTQRWEANDLIDILFLSCAAGYADVVVGERQTIAYLRQARMPPPRAQLVTTLEEAVALLAPAAQRNQTAGG